MMNIDTFNQKVFSKVGIGSGCKMELVDVDEHYLGQDF